MELVVDCCQRSDFCLMHVGIGFLFKSDSTFSFCPLPLQRNPIDLKKQPTRHISLSRLHRSLRVRFVWVTATTTSLRPSPLLTGRTAAAPKSGKGSANHIQKVEGWKSYTARDLGCFETAKPLEWGGESFVT